MAVKLVVLCGLNDTESYGIPDVFGPFPTMEKAEAWMAEHMKKCPILDDLQFDEAERDPETDEFHDIAPLQEAT